MKLDAKHFKAINFMCMGMSNAETARELNVCPETISKWRSDFDFKARLNASLKENDEFIREKMRLLSTKAVDSLVSVLDDPETPAQDKITASLKVLEINKVSQGYIGSSNAKTLEQEKKQDDFLEEYNL